MANEKRAVYRNSHSRFRDSPSLILKSPNDSINILSPDPVLSTELKFNIRKSEWPIYQDRAYGTTPSFNWGPKFTGL